MGATIGVILSEEAAKDVTDCVTHFKKNRRPQKQTPPPKRSNAMRWPKRGILLEDLVDGGTADFAVTNWEDTLQVQEVTILGAGFEGGTFKLGFKGQTSAAIDWNASPQKMQTALEALSTIGKGNVSVSLGAQKYTNNDTGVAATERPGVWLIEFKGVFTDSKTPPPLLTCDDNSLTGGFSPTVIVAATSDWIDTGDVETVVATIPVGTPTPMRAGAAIAVIWFPGVGYGFPGVEPRYYSTLGLPY